MFMNLWSYDADSPTSSETISLNTLGEIEKNILNTNALSFSEM